MRLNTFALFAGAIFFWLVLGSWRRTPEPTPPKIILITFDGVRVEEMFNGVDPTLSPNDTAPLMPYFRRELLKRGFLLGRNKNMQTGNTSRVSLPGYHNIMAGAKTPCNSNSCGQITVETLPEKLMRVYGWKKEQVAAIASWVKIEYAAERQLGTIFANGYKSPYLPDPLPDSIAQLNKELKTENHDGLLARNDRFTFAYGMHYLKTFNPHFMWFAFNEADYHGHLGKYTKYKNDIRKYDGYVKAIVEYLKTANHYKENTYIFITTDHGRGTGRKWKHHNAKTEGAQYVWFYAGKLNGKTIDPEIVASTDKQALYQIDIRPTIESVVGLKPENCANCGKAIKEVVETLD